MDIHASARFIKVAPRKVRLVIDAVRGKSVAYAIEQLQFTRKAAAKPLLRLINSALANAKNNFDLDTNDMYIKSIIANEGPTLKRYMPRAYGKADVIRKKMTHVNLVITKKEVAEEKKSGKAKKTEKNEVVKSKKEVKKKTEPKKKTTAKKSTPKKNTAKKSTK